MRSIFLYLAATTRADAREPGNGGADDEPLRPIRRGAFAAWLAAREAASTTRSHATEGRPAVEGRRAEAVR
jgi:hypothetical protein